MYRLCQSTVDAAMVEQHATRERDRKIAAGIDMRLKMALDDPDNDEDDDPAGALVPVG